MEGKMYTTNYTKTKSFRLFQLYTFCRIFVFILCLCSLLIFHTSAQAPSLAEMVYEKYRAFFQREDIQEILPTVLAEIRKPENRKYITAVTIETVVDSPDLLKGFIPEIDDEFITLLKEDQEVKAFLRDTDVQTLLHDVAAIDELSKLMFESKLSLAEKIHGRYLDLLMREDIHAQLPNLLNELKKPEIQALLTPETIKLVIENPDILKSFLPDIEDEFISLLKEDTEIMTFINDPDVQLLLQDTKAIDELAMLLSVPVPVVVTVKIVPVSIESPRVDEQLIFTVDIANGINVAGYQGTVNFDSSALKFVSLEHGTYLSDDGFLVPTGIIEGSVTFAQIIAAPDITAISTEGTLVTITFEVLDAKASMLTLSEVIISGLAGAQFQVIIENAEILEPPQTPWDVNSDGRVNILDLTFVASHFGGENPPPEADVNGDGRVNILDLTLVASHFGETT